MALPGSHTDSGLNVILRIDPDTREVKRSKAAVLRYAPSSLGDSGQNWNKLSRERGPA
jgi:hypothetical protein